MKDQYRKKPVVIDAYQLPTAGEDVPGSFHEWCQKVGFDTFESGRDETLIIPTLEGDMVASPGDWIIKGIAGEFYPCKPDIFAATYEPAEAALQSQVNSEAADRVREFLDNWLKIRLNDKTVVYKLNDLELRVDDLRALLTTQSQDREAVKRPVLDGIVDEIHRRADKEWADDGYDFEVTITADEYKALCEEEKSIDHARRVEGEAA